MDAITLYSHNASPDYDAKVARTVELLRQAVTRHAPLTQASSLGAEDMVVTDLLQRHGIAADVFVLDTRLLHVETLALLDRMQTHYGIRVAVHRPDAAAAQAFVAAHGDKAMYDSIALRKQCCAIRKLQPLEHALRGYGGWITGLRREQSGARADVPGIDTSGALPKINPLADWTWGDVWRYIAEHAVPTHPLHDQFYPSIGCAPCTRAISLGEDFRAGRWWWEEEAAKECGLHVQQQGAPA